MLCSVETQASDKVNADLSLFRRMILDPLHLRGVDESCHLALPITKLSPRRRFWMLIETKLFRDICAAHLGEVLAKRE